MKYTNIIKRDLNTILKNPYNKANFIKAIVRYCVYLLLKVFKIKKIKLKVWNDKKLFYYDDSIQSCWLLFNYYIDFEEFELISKYISKDDTFFDVGSNIGYYSVWASKFIQNGKIFAFEPNPRNFTRLNENCRLNKGVIQTFQLAISSKISFVKFTTQKDVLNHIIRTNDLSYENTEYERVESVDLDSFCTSNFIKNIDYLKLDVEGFELEVLEGARQLLADKKIKLIQLELEEENALKNSNYTVKEVLNLLNEYEYKLCKYDLKNTELLETEYSSNRDNYFATYDKSIINRKLKLK